MTPLEMLKSVFELSYVESLVGIKVRYFEILRHLLLLFEDLIYLGTTGSYFLLVLPTH